MTFECWTVIGRLRLYVQSQVIGNYSLAKIPLETMWTDIDYMYNRWIFTLDPERFPLEKVRWIVDSLHQNNQKYILMVDPAVAYQDYPTFNRGVEADIWLKESNGSIHKGVVWCEPAFNLTCVVYFRS